MLAFAALLFSFFFATAKAKGIGALHKIDLKRYPNAQCLDGSPGAFYFWKASARESSQKWKVHHQGGGWCSPSVPSNQTLQVDNCYTRSFTNFGSSLKYADDVVVGNGEESQSRDAVMNPLMHDWNFVYLLYCDGGSWAGRRQEVDTINGKEIHYKGGYILEAIMDTLRKEHGLNEATDLVVGGSSAGGLATYLHVDRWAAAVPSAFTTGLPDCGFFLDWSASTPKNVVGTYASNLRYVFHKFNSSAGVHQSCVSARAMAGGDLADCYFAEHTSPYIQSPIFALQSVTDSWQLADILGNSVDAAVVNGFSKQLRLRILDTFLAYPGRSGFFDSCLHHCARWATLELNKTHPKDFFSDWYNSERKRWEQGLKPAFTKSFWQAASFPCTECCGVSSDVERVPVDRKLSELLV
eukprot:TRINITY_DN13899_c0_g1_i3.p1 TRINITY_DN13899_c0_g1~~TRINITY_DN13899_c0_g1_i3.p1  ORF type:complete len:410 (-),score=63.56 TRINITY_DN13899_c0_g1_i3:213-1442(-)